MAFFNSQPKNQIVLQMRKRRPCSPRFLQFAVVPKICGGEGGIRTPGGLASSTVFKTAAIDHSAISPLQNYDFFLYTHYSFKKKFSISKKTLSPKASLQKPRLFIYWFSADCCTNISFNSGIATDRQTKECKKNKTSETFERIYRTHPNKNRRFFRYLCRKNQLL